MTKGERTGKAAKKKAGALLILLGCASILFATKTVQTETAPYFLVRDSFKTEQGYFVILQPASPVNFVAQVNQLEELPLKGEGQQCKIERIVETVNSTDYNHLEIVCKKWNGMLNTVIFPPR